MPRPKDVTETMIEYYDREIDQDQDIPEDVKNNSTIREVIRAGLWMSGELAKRNCPQSLIERMQFIAGQLCHDADPWEIHQEMLNSFDQNEFKSANMAPSNMLN